MHQKKTSGQQNQQNSSIESIPQFFKQIKEYMKMKSTNKLSMQQLKNYYPNPTETILGRIMGYIHAKTKFDKTLSNQECANALKTLLSQDKGKDGKFKIASDGFTYQSKYSKIVDKKTLLQEIEATPEGLDVGEQLLRFSCPNIKDEIQVLIHQRQIIPVKSKGIEKGKIKNNFYEGYILFPLPAEVKQLYSRILEPQMDKRQFESLDKNLQQRENKLKRVFRTKTQTFRNDFDSICLQNVNRSQGKLGNHQSSESIQKIFSGWNEINKNSVPNFFPEVEEWFKNRK